jgi:DNA-directed RNA polymerase subunit RPC12/RpoP
MSKNKNYKFDSTGLATKEKKIGLSLFKKYQEKYHIENISDLSILNELVFREVLQIRYKKKIETYSKSKTTESDATIPSNIIRFLDENLAKILELKEKLGLLQEKVGDDPFKYVTELKAKFKKWKEENQASRSLVCPHCSKMILLKIKTDIWEAQKHNMFKDKILYNEHLVNLYLDKKITKEDVAKILGCSDYYVDWLIEKWHERKEIEKKDEEKK